MLLSQEEQDKLKLNIKENNEKEENNKIGFNEPIPKTNFCNLCQRRFDNYLVHIETMIHKNNISRNPVLISRIQNSFKRVNQFWNAKNKNKNKIVDSNRNTGHSLSSLSSSQSFNSVLKSKSNNNIKITKNYSIDKVTQFNIYNENTINENQDKNNKFKKHTQLIKNIEIGKKEINNTDSIFDLYNKNSINLLMKKRKENIFTENDGNTKNEKDYFPDLCISKNKKLIRDVNIYFK